MPNLFKPILVIAMLLVALTACRSPEAPAAATPGPDAAAATPGEAASPAPPTAAGIVQPLDLAAVKNMTYTLPSGAEATLVDGVYEERPEGAATATINLSVIDNLAAFGDLDGDGVKDAAVILADAPGGSGIFMYLAAVLNEDGVPRNVDTVELGDRTGIDGNNIRGGVITLDVVAHDADDPQCCPTEQRRWTYRLANGQLEQAGDELLGTVVPEAPPEGTEGMEGPAATGTP